jgi:hypothetical protein
MKENEEWFTVRKEKYKWIEDMKLKAGYKQTPLQRIKRVINFYYNRGCNKESVNDLYRKILANRFNN